METRKHMRKRQEKRKFGDEPEDFSDTESEGARARRTEEYRKFLKNRYHPHPAPPGDNGYLNNTGASDEEPEPKRFFSLLEPELWARGGRSE